MLNPQDRDAIEGLFDRIEIAAAKGGPRDADAEVLIQQRLRNAPASPYYMAQTILVQEQAMRMAEQKIADLEAQVAQRPAGGFLGGVFGDSEPQRERPQARRQARGPWDRGEDEGYDNRQRGGGGFLAGAAQTALGVTTGVLLGSAIAGMLTGGANAQELNPDDQPADDQPADDQPADDNNDDQGDDLDAGGDDFDMGGDF